MPTKSKLSVLLFYVCFIISISSQESVSKSPLMGWASWNHFGVKISESIIKGQADGMVSSGLATAGYQYINIDDGFFDGRYPDGTLRIDSVKFPHGMKALVDYIHSKGLKAGFYSEAGANTCGSVYNNQFGGVGGGLYQHDQQDINLFFKTWDFDFLKVDFCGGKEQLLDERTRYTDIKKAIENTGRKDINYNVCRWQFPGTWVTSLANSWRISEDINVSWNSVINVIEKNTYLAPFASQGHYNDMDMLEVGRGMTYEEDKSHFSMWCILSAPLVLGNDLSTINKQTTDILTNAEVIAIDQDTTGVQGHLVTDNGAGLQVWAKNLNGKQSRERAVVLFNRSAVAAPVSVKWKDLNLAGNIAVRDVWKHTDIENNDSIFTAIVPSHGVVMLKVIGDLSTLQENFEAEYAWINNYNLTQYSVIVPNQGIVVNDTICSGRAKVSSLGENEGNYIEFRDIYASKTGHYHLTISYLSPNDRDATLSINGKDTLLTKLNSGGINKISNITFPVKLKKGINTIRFSNATSKLPVMDKIHLNLNRITLVEKTTLFIKKIEKLLKPSKSNK